MSEEEIRKYLAERAAEHPPKHAGPRPVVRQSRKAEEPAAAFQSFRASELYCPKCRRAVPVKEKHLLYLPSGDLFDCRCPVCSTSLGTRRA